MIARRITAFLLCSSAALLLPAGVSVADDCQQNQGNCVHVGDVDARPFGDIVHIDKIEKICVLPNSCPPGA